MKKKVILFARQLIDEFTCIVLNFYTGTGLESFVFRPWGFWVGVICERNKGIEAGFYAKFV